MDLNELRELAKKVTGWGNCNQSWEASNDDGYATYAVGAIDDGERYPVAEIDCAQYSSDEGADLARFYASANPAAILALIARLESAEKDSKRIDYLSSGASIVRGDGGFFLFWHTSGRCGPSRASQREAIDAAMQQEGGE